MTKIRHSQDNLLPTLDLNQTSQPQPQNLKKPAPLPTPKRPISKLTGLATTSSPASKNKENEHEATKQFRTISSQQTTLRKKTKRKTRKKKDNSSKTTTLSDISNVTKPPMIRNTSLESVIQIPVKTTRQNRDSNNKRSKIDPIPPSCLRKKSTFAKILDKQAVPTGDYPYLQQFFNGDEDRTLSLEDLEQHNNIKINPFKTHPLVNSIPITNSSKSKKSKTQTVDRTHLGRKTKTTINYAEMPDSYKQSLVDEAAEKSGSKRDMKNPYGMRVQTTAMHMMMMNVTPEKADRVQNSFEKTFSNYERTVKHFGIHGSPIKPADNKVPAHVETQSGTKLYPQDIPMIIQYQGKTRIALIYTVQQSFRVRSARKLDFSIDDHKRINEKIPVAPNNGRKLIGPIDITPDSKTVASKINRSQTKTSMHGITASESNAKWEMDILKSDPSFSGLSENEIANHVAGLKPIFHWSHGLGHGISGPDSQENYGAGTEPFNFQKTTMEQIVKDSDSTIRFLSDVRLERDPQGNYHHVIRQEECYLGFNDGKDFLYFPFNPKTNLYPSLDAPEMLETFGKEYFSEIKLPTPKKY